MDDWLQAEYEIKGTQAKAARAQQRDRAGLALNYINLGQPSLVLEYATKAYQLRDRANERETTNLWDLFCGHGRTRQGGADRRTVDSKLGNDAFAATVGALMTPLVRTRSPISSQA